MSANTSTMVVAIVALGVNLAISATYIALISSTKEKGNK